jgi:cysteine-rich repeat protein
MKLIRSLVSTVLGAGMLVAVACSGGAANDKPDRICTPGNYVFCRCADRTPGTKLCRQDGLSFEACTTGAAGECSGGEIVDPRTNEPVPPVDNTDASVTPPVTVNPLDACPGRSTAVQPNLDIKLEGNTTTATQDRKGRPGACLVGVGANDHIYRLIPSGRGALTIKVQGSEGLDPVAYVRTVCNDESAQASCGAPSPQKVAQLKLNVVTGREYFLVIDGASGSVGKYVATLRLTPGSFCGDGQVDDGEACDDGGNVDDDGCSSDCTKVSGNPSTGGACPGHPVHVWTGQTVIGTGSTLSYGNAFNAPSATCDASGTNSYQDHLYELTPHASGNLVVSLSAPSAGALPNLMLSARTTCASASATNASMCANQGGVGSAETMTFPVTANTKVFVAVDGGGVTNNKGDYAISFKIE